MLELVSDVIVEIPLIGHLKRFTTGLRLKADSVICPTSMSQTDSIFPTGEYGMFIFVFIIYLQLL